MKQKIKDLIPTPAFHIIRYLLIHKRWPNFKNPKTFSEKIFYRMINPRPIFSLMADKYAVREYIRSAVGEEYLVPLIFHGPELTDVEFNKLPKRFVMKANHSAGDVLLVTDKDKYDCASLNKISRQWLERDFSIRAREKHYASINRKIIIEEMLGDGVNPPDDYKVNIFRSPEGEEPFVFIQHMWGRGGDLSQVLYDKNWNVLPFQRMSELPDVKPPAPGNITEMLDVATALLNNLSYLRVDFYSIDGKLYVGELTITPGAGNYTFTDKSADIFLGERYQWPESM